jgi:LuxR family maltose regulon positive regulatory protein
MLSEIGGASAVAHPHAPSEPRSPILVSTKLNPPSMRGDRVRRSRLVDHLRGRPSSKLTLIDAPAGWGKTTLLAEWSAAEAAARRFAWVALDTADNDPARFWTYAVLALQMAEPEVGGPALAALRVPGARATETVLPALINDLAAIGRPGLALVLDDYHAVTNREIHEAVAFLLEHLPDSLHLVISTRSDPPLPLARLRARGEMTEVRAADLRFSETEAAAFLNEVLGLGLGAGEVARLHARTEGWAAGLYLAALSLRGRPDAPAFIEAFAGDHRHIVDYLGAEVLGGQTSQLREFLLRTSVLDRLCGPLCDAVMASSGSDEILEEIERSNLFLVPLDTRRHWYRYHHLFRELLRHELYRAEPGLVADLHRRASAWHRDRGTVGEAVHHAIASGDVTAAGELIARHWNAFIQRGRPATVVRWLDALPEAAVESDPRLCVARARTSLYLRRFEDVDRWVSAAERATGGGGPSEAAASVGSGAALLRAARLHMLGDVAAASRAARRAVELERDEPSQAQAMARAALGVTLYWSGEAEAEATLEEAIQVAEGTGDIVALLTALGYMAAIHLQRGELDEADEMLDRIATLVSDNPSLSEFMTTMALVGRGKVLEQRGQLDEADRLIGHAVELSRASAGLIEGSYGLLALAEVRHRQGAVQEAARLLSRARRVIRGCPDPGILRQMLERAERRLHSEAKRRIRSSRLTPAPDLSARELAVLRLLGTRLSRREIGGELFVSENTVKTHMRGLYAKLAASSREEAVARARELGLL